MSGGAYPAAGLLSMLEAFAAGDALGMATEFMTRQEIRDRFGLVEGLIAPELSKNHADLRRGQVTDDTEQVLALLDEYLLRGRIDPRETAERLLRWVRESGAIEKRYIGPSSKSALLAISGGADPAVTGMGGTSCGGVMRSSAAILFALCAGLPLEESVHDCLLPTHNTRPALEAAMAYAYALREALGGGDIPEIMAAAGMGAEAGAALAPWKTCGPSLRARLEHFAAAEPGFASPDDALDFLYYVYGTGLESVDVASAALCVFSRSPQDTWLCLRMGASVGGDTDTIAALAGMLSAAYLSARGKGHNIPAEVLDDVMECNGLNLVSLTDRLAVVDER